jgi:endonuclease YncB( thermonuclease family)
MLSEKKVWLTFDSECEDYYDRTLSYVHTGLEDNEFIQRLMLKGGWAETLAVEPNVSFRTLFQSDQAVAQSEDAGLWGDCR